MKKYYYVYQMTNMINDKIYVGKSSCNCLPEEDVRYTGNGKAIRRAKKKYGLINFTKDILYVFTKEVDAYAKEQDIVDTDFVNRKDTYNLCTGGLGGMQISEETRAKQYASQKKSMSRPEVRKKISDTLKNKVYPEGYYETRTEKTRHTINNRSEEETIIISKHYSDAHKKTIHTKEWNEKVSKALKGRKLTEEHCVKISERMSNRIVSEKTKKKMSNAKKGVPFRIVTCPHCGKTGGAQVMPRWHFNNCKYLTKEVLIE